MPLVERFAAALAAFRSGAGPAADGEMLALRRDLAAARMELGETREALRREQSRVAAAQQAQAEAVAQSVETRLARLFSAIAAPLSQLQTQAYLLAEGRPLQATDVMTLAMQLAQAAQDCGLEPVGSPGESLAFEPQTMQPLGEGPLQPGAQVTVRFVGYRLGGRVVHKALVEGGR